MTHKPSDLPAAAVGFFGGAILVGLILFAVSRWTSTQFEGHEAGAAPAAEHR